ncbi:hypothetical protein OOU_Y34scaffold00087g7 [Pyricularia oryzae Y34]|uniref:Uncharacterized protein n=1 Tax=Pyricularia oryzae (strain Y34) TaxID=1143189 RepID=A0AA97P9E0_PYRO3|nr:hypothetical protein OOU_Y34scaffold00087g7 [Pyricularia oryzae Y34]
MSPTAWATALPRSIPIFTIATRCSTQNHLSTRVLMTLRVARPQVIRFIGNSTAAKRAPLSSVVASSPKSSRSPSGASTSTTTTLSSARPTRESLSFAERLARLKEPAVLYRAPPHRFYRFSCYSSGLFCIMYVGYHYTTSVLYAPPDVTWWLPHAFAVIVAVMGVLGAYFITGAWRLVRVIRAVPRASGSALAPAGAATKPAPQMRRTAAQRAAAAADAAATHQLPIRLEVTATRLLPFFPPKVTLLEPADLVLPAQYVILRHMGEHVKNPDLAKSKLGVREQLQAIKDAKARAVAEAEYDKRNLLTSPFRHMARAFGTMFRTLHRSLTRAGFVNVEAQGMKYKLDVMESWALEDGRALDRLVRVQERSNLITSFPQERKA